MDFNQKLEEARRLIRRDRPEEGRQILTELFANGHRSFSLFIELALAHLMLGHDVQAKRYLSLADGLDSGNTRVLCYKGFLALVERRYNLALEYFKTSLDADPNNVEAYKWRGLCFRELDLPERALADLDRAALILKGDATLLINRGTVYADLGRFERALSDFQKACEISPQHAHPHFNTGHVLVELGRFEEAREHYDMAIELDHLATEAWAGLASVFAQQEDWSEVLRCLATVLAIKPNDLEAQFKVGQVLIELGDFARGLEHLEKVLEEKGEDIEALTFRAVANFQLNHLPLALEDCQRVLQLAPEFGLAHLYHALILLEMGTPPEEGPYEQLLQARTLTPGHPLPPLVLAEIVAQKGSQEDAIGYLAEALKLDLRLLERIKEVQPLLELLEHPDLQKLLPS